MKRTISSLLAAVICTACLAQTSADFKARYERQVRNVGASGIGVETIINNWEEAFPDDPDVYVSRFSYNFAKASRVEVVTKDVQRFLGAKPVLTLKDSEGKDVNYFEETFYEDSLYAAAMTAIDKAISMRPLELRYRFYKITSTIAYEKESPDMAYSQIIALLDHNKAEHPAWTLDGEPAGEDTFVEGMGEYCYSFYSIGTDLGYEYFRALSEKMTKLYPKNAVFYSNIGSYYQVCKKNNKQALKYYNKALKLDPDNYAAKRNIKIIQSSQSKKGQSSK